MKPLANSSKAVFCKLSQSQRCTLGGPDHSGAAHLEFVLRRQRPRTNNKGKRTVLM